MNVGWVDEDNLYSYLNNWRSCSYEGDRFAGYLVAMAYDSAKRMYCIVSEELVTD